MIIHQLERQSKPPKIAFEKLRFIDCTMHIVRVVKNADLGDRNVLDSLRPLKYFYT